MISKSWLLFMILIVDARAERKKCLENYELTFEKHFYVDEQDLSLKIEVSERITHQLVSHIVRILLREVIGYSKVDLVDTSSYRKVVGENATLTLQKITNCKEPKNCEKYEKYVPNVMINLETWLVPGFNMEGWIATGRVEDCGPLGPVGRSGWFVPEYSVRQLYLSNEIFLDHWRAFTNPKVAMLFDMTLEDNMLESFTFNPHTSTKYCSLSECGKSGIYKPPKCRKNKIRCATLLADYSESTYHLLKQEIIQLELYVNVAWVGKNLENIVRERIKNQKHTLFYHKKPSYLSSLSNFSQITFPQCAEDSSAICEYNIFQLQKVAWSAIKIEAPQAFHLLRAVSFTQSGYTRLLENYNRAMMRDLSVQDVACTWVTDNSYEWTKWIPDGHKNKTNLYIGGIFPLNGTYWRQGGVATAAQLAVEAVNRNHSLLSNYKLTLLIEDGHCLADQVMKSFINYVTNSVIYKTMVGILGPACSDTVEPIAGVARHFNTVIISYSAEGSLFSDREKYPFFLRTIPENNQFRFVYLKLFQQLGWSRVAALTEDGQKYPEYISHLQDLMQTNGMTFITNSKFPREMLSLNLRTFLEDLRQKNAKIIIGDFYDYAARAVMCEAYKLGMTASNGYQWFLPLWFTSDWFDTDLYNHATQYTPENVSCSTREMIEAINGHMSLAYKFYADDNTIIQDGKTTVKEWKDTYRHFTKQHKMEESRYAGYAYDAVWLYALALQRLFEENDSQISSLHTSKTSKKLVRLLNSTSFSGVSGHLQFVGSSRISEIVVWQWLKNTTRQIGVYKPLTNMDGNLELDESRILWLTQNGLKPNDGGSSGSNPCPIAAFQELLQVSCEVAVGIVNAFAILVLLSMVVMAFFFFKRKYLERMKKTEARMKELGILNASGVLALDGWEMRREHVVINRKLGEGAFGTVYGGEALVTDKGWIAVAVKTLKNGAKPEEKVDFLSEAEIMKKFDHTNIVQLVGVCTMSEPVYTVMEFMLYGDLKTYLLGRRNLVDETDRSKSDDVSDRRLTNMAMDITRGLSYLANLKFVHRDLACRNCLVATNRTVKIADFGMCRAMYDSDYYRFSKKGMLPVRWMAPESLIDGVFSPMSDVWSFGVVMYEIITFGSFPYQGLSNNQVLEYVKSYNTLNVPKGCKSELEDLLKKCWSRIPEERPQAVEMYEMLANSPELISPCLDVPMASVEVQDSDSLELTIHHHERPRVHSVTSLWRNKRHLSIGDQVSNSHLSMSGDHSPAAVNIEDPTSIELKVSSPESQKSTGIYVILNSKGLLDTKSDKKPASNEKQTEQERKLSKPCDTSFSQVTYL